MILQVDSPAADELQKEEEEIEVDGKVLIKQFKKINILLPQSRNTGIAYFVEID